MRFSLVVVVLFLAASFGSAQGPLERLGLTKQTCANGSCGQTTQAVVATMGVQPVVQRSFSTERLPALSQVVDRVGVGRGLLKRVAQGHQVCPSKGNAAPSPGHLLAPFGGRFRR